MKRHTPDQVVTSAQQAMDYLKEGNTFYTQEGDKAEFEKLHAMYEEGQNPFAIVVCCSDSRVAPELFFNQRLGDLFVVRNAGNVIDETALGSIEYAVEHLNVPLIVVCGHSSCGAVTAACGDDEIDGNLGTIIKRIDKATKDGGSVEDVTRRHTVNMVDLVKENPTVKAKGATVAAAYYDISTGVVSWL